MSQCVTTFPNHYTPYNMATRLVSLKANISFLYVLRALKQQYNLNKTISMPIGSLTSLRMTVQYNDYIVYLYDQFV